jgi:acetoacetyl-CoA synthetase
MFVRSRPSAEASRMTRFAEFCAAATGRNFADHASFHQFSVGEFRTFWKLFLQWSGLPVAGVADPVCTSDDCATAEFFPALRLNYAEALLVGDDDAPALISLHDDRPAERLTRGELRLRVACAAAALQAFGVVAGDRVVAIARNDAASVVAALASASIGASFSTAPPEMGEAAILSRFRPLAPRILFGHTHAPGVPELGAHVAAVADALDGLAAVIALDAGEMPGLTRPACKLRSLMEPGRPALQSWPRLPFNQPLFILFSSGTTGEPKCIVHGAGGTLLEHMKEHVLHGDLARGERLFFQTSCAWMMWNWQLSALATGAEIVLFDGVVAGPETLWRIVSDERVTRFGTSPAYLKLCEDKALQPTHTMDLGALRSVMSTGSVLHDAQFDWFARALPGRRLQSISGGTDIIGCFVLGHPDLPVKRGTAQCVSLGMDVRALPHSDDMAAGEGELVCANPFPSRPLGFFGDDGTRFHAAYFAQHPGVWTHGDRITLDADGSARILGRSDGVMNIRGIRIGPAEIYGALSQFPEIAEALAVEQTDSQELGGTRLVLLVVTHDGALLTPDLTLRLRRAIGAQLTAAHVPSVVAQVAELPITHSGKLSETAARDIISGRPVRNKGALRNPHCLDALARHPALRRQGRARALAAADASIEVQLTALWETLFDLSPISPDDDFFQLGGDSLLGMELMAGIEEITGQALPLAILFNRPTIAGLSETLKAGIGDRFDLLVPVKSGEGAPLFAIHSMAGSVLEQHRLLNQIDTPRPVVAVQARGMDPRQKPQTQVEEMATSYIAALREMQPRGPYALVGFSFGGEVAYEMARQLTAAGDRIALLALLDAPIHPRFLPIRQRLRFRLGQLIQLYGNARGRPAQVALRFIAREALRVADGVLLRLGKRPHRAFRDALNLPPALRRVRGACEVAYTAYRPGPHAGRTLYIRATIRAAHLSDPLPLWRSLAPALEVREVAATHLDLVTEPAVRSVAAILADELNAASPAKRSLVAATGGPASHADGNAWMAGADHASTA